MTAVRMETLADGKATLHCGDNLDALKALESNSVDSCATDPPYGLGLAPDAMEMLRAWLDGGHYDVRSKSGFMGKEWDAFVPQPAVWKEVYRVLKPGAHALCFFGTRTYDLGVLAIRLAGFEIRDSVAWLYGSGFPKSLDVSKAIDKAAGYERGTAPDRRNGPNTNPGSKGDKFSGGYLNQHEIDAGAVTEDASKWSGFGTALKPACEPIVLARKPLSESTVAANVLEWGTGALNIDGSRVATDEGLSGGAYREGEASAERTYADKGGTNFAMKPGMRRRGRSPLNGDERTGAALGMFQEGKTVGAEFKQPPGRWPANVIHDGSEEVVAAFPDNLSSGTGAIKKATGAGTQANAYGKESRAVGTPNIEYGDSGSAARFFYTAKADADDRLGSKHPTVKPLDLMQYLVRLITPPKGLVLDPFAGTGTTGEACIREGMRAVLIEREPEYQDDIRRRMKLAMAGPDERKREGIKVRLKDKPEDHGPLFGGALDTPPRGTGQTDLRTLRRSGRTIGPTGLKW